MREALQLDRETDALLVVHVQRDFCPGGSLRVPHGDEVVPVLNDWLAVPGLLKIATRDWHPANHCSFKAQGGPWPPHCVQGTPGAQFHPGLQMNDVAAIISTATDSAREAYSGFDSPDLLRILHDHVIQRLWIGGLATEYCVKATVLDALQNGFQAFVIEDGIRGIEATPGDCDRAIREMESAGAEFVRTASLQTPPPAAGVFPAVTRSRV